MLVVDAPLSQELIDLITVNLAVAIYVDLAELCSETLSFTQLIGPSPLEMRILLSLRHIVIITRCSCCLSY